MYSVFEPSIITSILDMFESVAFFYRNLDLTEFVMVDSGSRIVVDFYNHNGTFVTGLLNGYATVLCSQVLIIE